MGNPTPWAGLHVSSGRPTLSLDPLAQIQDEDNVLFDNLRGASDVAVEGNLLAVAAADDHAVTFLDISDRSNPTLIDFPSQWVIRDGEGPFNSLAGATSLALSGAVLAVAAKEDNAVTLVNLTNPTFPALYSHLRDGEGTFEDLEAASDV
jgi:hypothetical protein